MYIFGGKLTLLGFLLGKNCLGVRDLGYGVVFYVMVIREVVNSYVYILGDGEGRKRRFFFEFIDVYCLFVFNCWLLFGVEFM